MDLLRGFPILVTHGTEDTQIPIRAAHDTQVIPPMFNSTRVRPAAAAASGTADMLFSSQAGPWPTVSP